MDEIRLNVQQAIKALNMSKSTLYNWMKNGDLKFQDSPRGRIIITTEKQIREIQELNNHYSNTVLESSIENQSEVLENPRPSNTDLILELTNKIENLSKQAGKTELLTDNIIVEQGNKEHWQNEYYKINYELRTSQENITQYKKRLNSLKMIISIIGLISAIFIGLYVYKINNPTVIEKTKVVTQIKYVPKIVTKKPRR